MVVEMLGLVVFAVVTGLVVLLVRLFRRGMGWTAAGGRDELRRRYERGDISKADYEAGLRQADAELRDKAA